MNSFLVHGVYDFQTFQTLSQMGITQIGFDLRGKSRNLIPFADLNILLPQIKSTRACIIFEDDKITTVLSFLNLLKNSPVKLILELRDQQSPAYYQNLGHDFFWMYRPGSDWQGILNCDNLKAILLPYKWKDDYKKMTYLWDTIEKKNLEVFIHAENLKEAILIPKTEGMKLSVDLTFEVEKGFRTVDQDYLKNSNLWGKYNENIARQ